MLATPNKTVLEGTVRAIVPASDGQGHEIEIKVYRNLSRGRSDDYIPPAGGPRDRRRDCHCLIAARRYARRQGLNPEARRRYLWPGGSRVGNIPARSLLLSKVDSIRSFFLPAC